MMITSVSLSAKDYDLSDFLTEELKVITQNLEDADKGNADSHQLSKVRVRLRGKGGLEVPFLAKFELKPIVEFHFKKK
jgi:hypothetical protein